MNPWVRRLVLALERGLPLLAGVLDIKDRVLSSPQLDPDYEIIEQLVDPHPAFEHFPGALPGDRVVLLRRKRS